MTSLSDPTLLCQFGRCSCSADSHWRLANGKINISNENLGFGGKIIEKGPPPAPPRAPPDDDNDAVEAIIGILDVTEEAESQELQQHLKAEQTCEHHVTDLQNVCQLLRLRRYWTGTQKNEQMSSGSEKSSQQDATSRKSSLHIYSVHLCLRYEEKSCPRMSVQVRYPQSLSALSLLILLILLWATILQLWGGTCEGSAGGTHMTGRKTPADKERLSLTDQTGVFTYWQGHQDQFR